jgi:hypothetical protein
MGRMTWVVDAIAPLAEDGEVVVVTARAPRPGRKGAAPPLATFALQLPRALLPWAVGDELTTVASEAAHADLVVRGTVVRIAEDQQQVIVTLGGLFLSAPCDAFEPAVRPGQEYRAVALSLTTVPPPRHASRRRAANDTADDERRVCKPRR